MSTNPPIRFSHNHHLLKVKGCEPELDVLAFEGDEALSTPSGDNDVLISTSQEGIIHGDVTEK